ncbi:hypothetical protein GCM10023063_18070 [Arthrobacter methylotrophus]|uniref:Uncharacterized protein n=1 Tax=Arthrobacter methylotrophus TaxID=121291 RepID=A0ABV5UNW5_9MICC
MSRKKKIAIIALAAVTIILTIIGISSCTADRASESKASGSGNVSTGSSSYYGCPCVPPLACGPYYSGYVPPYYLAHPAYTLLTPYRSYYVPSYNGRSYTAARTPAADLPVAPRSPMPYPPGYKPVPGDFRPPTAPTAKPVVPAPVPKVQAPAAPVKAPSVPRSSRK